MSTLEQRLAYYDMLVEYLNAESKGVCFLNGCTDEEHQCGCIAYFEKLAGVWQLCDLCLPDYAEKVYRSYVSLPFDGDTVDLLEELELHDLVTE